MSTALINQDFLATADVLSGVITAHIPQSLRGLSLQINVPDFGCPLAFLITEVNSEMESGTVVLRAAIDSDSTIVLTLKGELFREDDRFHIQQVGLNIETTAKLARSDFILTTLRAIFSLAEQVQLQIPELQLDLSLKFDAPLLEISQVLRRRQTAYRIMVIERATGLEFQLPLNISGEQVSDIFLAYHAIIEHSFDWTIKSITLPLLATEEWLARLNDLNRLNSYTFGPDLITKTIFGKRILLGKGFLTVENIFIEEFDKIKQELARNDGHTVPVVVRSLSGHGRYDFPEAPRLPSAPWDEKIQGLINLEGQLDVALVKHYHSLAASTLEGLTEEEKTAITARPELDESAFSIEG